MLRILPRIKKLNLGMTFISIAVMLPFFYCSRPERTVTDIDGNVYRTVKIGNQVWMAENLKVTRYRNGDPIPIVGDNTEWSNLATGAYCDYENDETHVPTYGRLYNWFAVNDPRNIAPEGWHVPSDEEWETLVDHLGGRGKAGGRLKESGYTHWQSPNKGATNEGGFSALPGGYRDHNGYFKSMGEHAYFWSSDENVTDNAYSRYLYYYSEAAYKFNTNVIQYGFSVRILRD